MNFDTPGELQGVGGIKKKIFARQRNLWNIHAEASEAISIHSLRNIISKAIDHPR